MPGLRNLAFIFIRLSIPPRWAAATPSWTSTRACSTNCLDTIILSLAWVVWAADLHREPAVVATTVQTGPRQHEQHSASTWSSSTAGFLHSFNKRQSTTLISGSSLWACATTSGYQQFLTSREVSPTGRSLATTVTWDNPVGVHDGEFPCCRLGLLDKASALLCNLPGWRCISESYCKRPSQRATCPWGSLKDIRQTNEWLSVLRRNFCPTK